jgi:hypothetical protein
LPKFPSPFAFILEPNLQGPSPMDTQAPTTTNQDAHDISTEATWQDFWFDFANGGSSHAWQ